MREVVFAIQQIGPYHHARFQALAEDMEVLIIETRPNDTTYSWETEFPNAKYKRITYSKNIGTLKQHLLSKTVFICGWYDKEMLHVLLAATLVKAKCILISDSRAADAERIWWKEIVKSLILKFYHGALVAGKESTDYLRQLGFRKQIEKPWDVIDESLWQPTKSVVKENYWVFPARYILEKNHIPFFTQLMSIPLEQKPRILCCGYGPLEEEVKLFAKKFGTELNIEFLGNLNQTELIPILQKAKLCVLPSKKDTWGLVVNEALAAGTPILVSENCGAKELIVDGENGFVLTCKMQVEHLLAKIKSIEFVDYKTIKVPDGFKLSDFVRTVKLLTE